MLSAKKIEQRAKKGNPWTAISKAGSNEENYISYIFWRTIVHLRTPHEQYHY